MESRSLFSPENYKKTYVDSCKIGDTGLNDVLPLVEKSALNGRFVITDKGNLSVFLQKTVGDIIMNCNSGKTWAIEVKTEKEGKTNNFFLEMWSNRERYTVGWMFTLNADFLWYYILDAKTLYSIQFELLRAWAFKKGKIYLYPEKSQKKYEQLNDSWGRCVPISVVEREVGFRKFVKGVDF